jgi:hypothetical protein
VTLIPQAWRSDGAPEVDAILDASRKDTSSSFQQMLKTFLASIRESAAGLEEDNAAQDELADDDPRVQAFLAVLRERGREPENEISKIVSRVASEKGLDTRYPGFPMKVMHLAINTDGYPMSPAEERRVYEARDSSAVSDFIPLEWVGDPHGKGWWQIDEDRYIGEGPPALQRALAIYQEEQHSGGLAAGLEEMDAEKFVKRYPDQVRNMPSGAGRIVVVPDAAVTFYRPETLAGGLEEVVAAEQNQFPGLRIDRKPIPASAAEVELLALFIVDPLLKNLSYRPPVPVVEYQLGQPFPYRLTQLIAMAVLGRKDDAIYLISAWTFEHEGRQLLALAVLA